MARKTLTMKFLTRGGRVPLSLLRALAEEGMVHGSGTIAVGSRQEIHLPGISWNGQRYVQQVVGTHLGNHHPQQPNIVTTRSVTERSHRTDWLSEGTYDTILDTFKNNPGIAVDIVDPRQTYVPLFTGQLHFVATAEPDYWMVTVNNGPNHHRTSLSNAIHSDDVAAVTSLIQENISGTSPVDLPALNDALEKALGSRVKNLDGLPLSFPTSSRPLAGFVLDPKSDCFSLSIPLQLQDLPGPFLVDIAVFADRFGITTAHLTPWKSLLIHGIPRSQRVGFEKLLLHHRINLNSGAWDHVCLNGWATPPLDTQARRLIQALNKRLPHSGTLSLALVNKDDGFPDLPIIIRAETTRDMWGRIGRLRYSLFARENFERHNPALVLYGANISSGALIEHVIALIDCYGAPETMRTAAPKKIKEVYRFEEYHRCRGCGTEYSEMYGDPLGNVAVGVPFYELPDSWHCPTCEAPLSEFTTAKRDVA